MGSASPHGTARSSHAATEQTSPEQTSPEQTSPEHRQRAAPVSRLLARTPLEHVGPTKLPWDDPAFSDRMLREHLDQQHDRASRSLPIVDAHVDWIFDDLLAGRPSAVLDLGCGPGLYTERLAERGCTCLGLDISPASIRYAERIAADRALHCSYRVGDIRTADLGSDHDLAMCIFGEFNTFARTDAAASSVGSAGASGPTPSSSSRCTRTLRW